MIRVNRMWRDGGGALSLSGPWFARPVEVDHEPSRMFIKREVRRLGARGGGDFEQEERCGRSKVKAERFGSQLMCCRLILADSFDDWVSYLRK